MVALVAIQLLSPIIALQEKSMPSPRLPASSGWSAVMMRVRPVWKTFHQRRVQNHRIGVDVEIVASNDRSRGRQRVHLAGQTRHSRAAQPSSCKPIIILPYSGMLETVGFLSARFVSSRVSGIDHKYIYRRSPPRVTPLATVLM
ncbi:hypothetical protein KL941_004732 [Ogataea angusta]|nr:hypothetical protein KL941_004732 [Ogataea angusta]